MMLLMKYLSNFWRVLEMSLINYELNFMLSLSEKCIISFNAVANQEITFVIIDTKLYIPIVTLSVQDNIKLLQQLKSGFKRMRFCVNRRKTNIYIIYLIQGFK